MDMKRWLALLAIAAALLGGRPLAARDFGLAYTTEWQTDFRGQANWVNLLRADFGLSLTPALGMKAAAISVAKTREERLMDDLLTFSNIEEDNVSLALAVCGLEWRVKRSAFFIGIRNVNEDYFASECTSLFTNSSCGIFPTLSCNYPIANYPLASVGLDYKLMWEHWTLETSLYNGKGYNRFAGRQTVFRFCPRADGLFSITSLNGRTDDGNYFSGFALYDGVPVADEGGNEEQAVAAQKKELNATWWAYAEQKLSPCLSALVQYSFSTVRQGCRQYAGGGLVLHAGTTTGGLFVGYAGFAACHEWACEATWHIPCLRKGYIQPALHWVRNSYGGGVAGLLRLGIEI